MIYYVESKEEFHVIPITSFKGKKEAFSSTSKMLDQFYEDKAEKDRVRQQAQDLKRFVNNELKKNKRKLNIHKKTLKRAKDAEKYQRLGDRKSTRLNSSHVSTSY